MLKSGGRFMYKILIIEDDFIKKPVDPNVMIAKIQAILRRTYDMAGKVPVLEHRGAIY